MGLLKFLASKTFFKHLGISIILTTAIFWLVITAIDNYTDHGDEIEVPGLTGINIDDLEQMNFNGDFQYLVIDSVYDDHFNQREIVLQDPLPGSMVKKGRKIYITIVATQPEMVLMPDFVDLSLRQALMELKSNSLKLDKLVYVTNFAKNAVLAQKIEGDTVVAGTEVLKGTPVELVLGKGISNEKIEIPFLIGMTENEAIKTLNNSSFNVGYLKYLDGRDKQYSRVYMQQPPGVDGEKAEFGAYVDLWFRSELYFNFDSLLQSFNTDTLQADILNYKKEF